MLNYRPDVKVVLVMELSKKVFLAKEVYLSNVLVLRKNLEISKQRACRHQVVRF